MGRVGSPAVDVTFPLVRLADVAAVVVGADMRGDPQTLVRDGAYDSRAVSPGCLFFCIPGAVADGHDFATDAIAKRLHLSSWTIQDHLKAIFEKVGVATRGELVARLYFERRAPRLAEDA